MIPLNKSSCLCCSNYCWNDLYLSLIILSLYYYYYFLRVNSETTLHLLYSFLCISKTLIREPKWLLELWVHLNIPLWPLCLFVTRSAHANITFLFLFIPQQCWMSMAAPHLHPSSTGAIHCAGDVWRPGTHHGHVGCRWLVGSGQISHCGCLLGGWEADGCWDPETWQWAVLQGCRSRSTAGHPVPVRSVAGTHPTGTDPGWTAARVILIST